MSNKRSTANRVGQIIFAALAILGLAATFYILVFITNNIIQEPVVGLSLGSVFLSICMLVISPVALMSIFFFIILRLSLKRSKNNLAYGRRALWVALASAVLLFPMVYAPESAFSLFLQCSAVGVWLLAAVTLAWGIVTLRRSR